MEVLLLQVATVSHTCHTEDSKFLAEEEGGIIYASFGGGLLHSDILNISKKVMELVNYLLHHHLSADVPHSNCRRRVVRDT